ncbi:TetR/AcrR family transcriptional regulator [Brachyspira sp.]|uniref:TetR/AcrR family transcriptional regulator n=1 Tax=Brachyspira sp. TaxID=1977261 RepID=UPI003D7C3D1B
MSLKEKNKKEDLRVVKTKEIIRNTFKSMILEMDYDYITIKELTERAKINRKTFYLHYESLDDLLLEIQDSYANVFIEKQISYTNIEDMKYLIGLFFDSTNNEPLNERILCSGSYRNISDRIVKKVMDYRKKTNRGAFSDNEAYENIIFAYYGANSAIIYRQWVADGKKLSLEEVKELAIKLVCNGLESIMKP